MDPSNISLHRLVIVYLTTNLILSAAKLPDGEPRLDRDEKFLVDPVPGVLLPLESCDHPRIMRCLKEGELVKQVLIDHANDLILEAFKRTLQSNPLSLRQNEENIGPEPTAQEFKAALLDISSEHQKILKLVQSTAPAIVNDIFDKWERLKTLSEIFMDTLEKRWRKRTTEKRKNVLLNAWPGMHPTHRPDFHAIRQNQKGPEIFDAIMVPFINLEDLISIGNLPSFIKSRSQEAPEYFAWSDSRPFRTATSLNAVSHPRSFETLMLLTGQKTRATYGRLVIVKENLEATKEVQAAYGFPLGKGLATLQVHQKTYGFLLNVVEQLLCDLDISKAIPRNILRQVPLSESCGHPILSLDLNENRSISDLNIRASYELPVQFSLESLRKLATASRDQAEDAYWGLREDPAYFLEQLDLHFEQNLGPYERMFKEDSFGGTSEAAQNALHTACQKVVHQACRDIILWDAISTDLLEFEKLRANIETEVDLLCGLPLEYERGLERLLDLLEVIWSHHCLNDVDGVLMANPNLQRYYEIVPGPESRSVQWRLKESMAPQYPPILKLFLELKDSMTADMMGAVNILDEMERTINSDPVQQELVTNGMAKYLSRVAAFAYIKDSLAQRQPPIKNSGDFITIIDEITDRLDIINVLGRHCVKMRLSKYALPRKEFDYPAEKRPTKEHVGQMRFAEAKLDTLWRQVDEGYRRDTGKTLNQWMGNRLTARELHRTAPWEAREEKAPRSKRGPSSSEDYQFPVHIVPDVPEKFSTERKTKQKTRGEADKRREAPSQEPKATDAVEKPLQTFYLDPRALKTMSSLFPSTKEDRTNSTILWKDFRYAMAAMHFKIHCRDGSIWYFEPAWNPNVPILIHMPHNQTARMWSTKMRIEASRLADRYGWSKETFQPA